MYTVKKVRSTGQNNMKVYINTLESIFYKNVKENYPSFWNSDLIIMSLLRGSQSLFNERKISISGNTIQSKWRIYKSVEAPEARFGDAGILGKISYHDGQVIEGAAFMEFHLKDPDKNTFSSIKSTQVKKLNSNAHGSQLVLLDYDSITGMAFPAEPESVIGNYPHSWNNWAPITSAASISAGMASALGIKHTGLYKAALPLSYQICSRYLFGLDFDCQKTAVDIVKNTRTDKGLPEFIIHLSVAHGGAELSDDFEIDTSLFREVE